MKKKTIKKAANAAKKPVAKKPAAKKPGKYVDMMREPKPAKKSAPTKKAAPKAAKKPANAAPVKKSAPTKPAAKKTPAKAAAPAPAASATKPEAKTPRVWQNDVLQPKPGSVSAEIWGIADALSAKLGRPPARFEVRAAVDEENKRHRQAGQPALCGYSVSFQYFQWRRFHGIAGRASGLYPKKNSFILSTPAAKKPAPATPEPAEKPETGKPVTKLPHAKKPAKKAAKKPAAPKQPELEKAANAAAPEPTAPPVGVSSRLASVSAAAAIPAK